MSSPSISLLPPLSIPSLFSLYSSHTFPPHPSSLQVVRTTGLRALHGLFYSVAGPQGLTAQLNGQLISVSTTSSLTPLSSHSSPFTSVPPPFLLRLPPSPSLSLLLSPPPSLSLPLPPSLSLPPSPSPSPSPSLSLSLPLPPSYSLSLPLPPSSSLSFQSLYDYQPSLVDAQMLQVWLIVMQSAHTRLAR